MVSRRDLDEIRRGLMVGSRCDLPSSKEHQVRSRAGLEVRVPLCRLHSHEGALGQTGN